MEELDTKEQFLLARFFYKNGWDYISDAEYENLRAKLAEEEPDCEELKQSWSDDKTPIEALHHYGLSDEQIAEYDLSPKVSGDDTNRDSYYSLMEETESKSIHSTWSLQEAYTWFEAHANIPLLNSPKVDGFNISTLYLRSDTNEDQLDYMCTYTRGGRDKAINISRNASRVLPQHIHCKGVNNIQIRMEGQVPISAVPGISEVLGHQYKSPKNAAQAIAMRTDVPTNVYSNLVFHTIRASYGDSLLAGLNFAKAAGFDTIEHKQFTYRHMPYTEFVPYITKLLKEVKSKAEETLEIKTDGVVVEVDSSAERNAEGTSGHTDNAVIGLKMLLWEAPYFESEVENILVELQDVECNVRVKVKPVTTDSGKVITYVNIFNLPTLISEDIKIGDTIRFIYRNDTTVDLIRKSKYSLYDDR